LKLFLNLKIKRIFKSDRFKDGPIEMFLSMVPRKPHPETSQVRIIGAYPSAKMGNGEKAVCLGFQCCGKSVEFLKTVLTKLISEPLKVKATSIDIGDGRE
jgi:hypothetical protein